jgi:hypothetical protein
MAYIVEVKGGWRAQVEKRGVRKTKTTKTREDAQLWADACEAQIMKRATRLTMKQKIEAAESLLMTAIPKRVLNALSEIPHDMEEVLEAAIPYRHGTGIYFLIKDKEVVYVGQSTDVFHRMARHRRDSRDFDSFAYIECEKEKLDELEAAYITAFVPLLNLSLGKMPKSVTLFAGA